MTTIMNGRLLAEEMQEKLRLKIAQLKEKQLVPGLVVLLVGDDLASQTYVRNKSITAEKLGINSQTIHFPSSITEAALLKEVNKYNHDDRYHGILVQLPLPGHIDEEKVLLAIDPKKDVDGFHPLNMGKLFLGKPETIPCTPYGIMKLLEAYQVKIAGKQAVVIGRSNIVGKPMAQLLLSENATVTIAHSNTHNLTALTSQADILISAVGRADFITRDMVKEQAVVVDVGINRDANGKLTGDVDFEQVAPVTSFITPVPKGVGPMTITMLMEQTVRACQKQEFDK
ncbi:MAG TPA: bifunctional methylenetetrahydrofolate dehydrogenase/methenyltetrahydrofolate cyclohydrolase [Tetragenococcus sp.]|nr:bifunctional methylenetetrahydrofolate dehydrogenase/methenyltetrahydrofolate cyclohydrolase [Tetragenococcus sp.]